MTDPGPDEPTEARIVITWPGDGSDPQVAIERVSWTQLYSAAWLLDQVAQEQRKAAIVQGAMERAATVELARSLRERRS